MLETFALALISALSAQDEPARRPQALHAQLPPAQTADVRVARDYRTVLNRLFPVDPRPDERRRKRRWRLVVRVSPDAEPEEQLAIEQLQDGTVQLEVARAEERSVFTQMEALYASAPDLTPHQAVPLIKISRRSFQEASLPQLRTWVRELQKACVPVVLDVGLLLHGTSYEMWSLGAFSSLDGPNHWSMSLVGPGPGARKHPNALVQLIERMRRDLRRLKDLKN